MIESDALIPADALPEGFKMTELGPLPEEWQVVRLGEVATLKQGKTPKISQYSDTHGYRIIKVKDFEDGGIVSITPSGERSFVSFEINAPFRVRAGDVLILNSGHSSSIVGQKVGIVPKELDGCLFVAELTAIRALDQVSDPYFIFACLMHPALREIIRGLVKGSHLYTRQLMSIPIPLPPLPEQRAIAYVLRTVQEAKEATERVITTLKELKKSLMRHLFTYGPVPLDRTGQVELQETELGPLPAHWRVVRLGEVVEVKGGKRLPKGDKFSEIPTPYPYLRVVNFRAGSIDISNLRFLTPNQHNILKKYVIKKEDVYISIAGTIGMVGKIPSELDGAHLTENAARIILKRDDIHQFFLIFSLSNERGQQQIQLRATKTSQPKLALARIKEIPIPLPPLPEQQEIARMLQAVDEKIAAEERRRSALAALFKSLLSRLMSGRVRVPKEWVAQFAQEAPGSSTIRRSIIAGPSA